MRVRNYKKYIQLSFEIVNTFTKMGNKNTCVVILSMVKINQYSRKQKFKKIKCLASSLPPPPPPEKKINETLFNSKYITNLTPSTSKCNTQKLNSVKSSAVAL